MPAGMTEWRSTVDWSRCGDVERVPGRLSGAVVIKRTRIPPRCIIENARACTGDPADFSAEGIAAELYPDVPLDVVRRVIAFALQPQTLRPEAS